DQEGGQGAQDDPAREVTDLGLAESEGRCELGQGVAQDADVVVLAEEHEGEHTEQPQVLSGEARRHPTQEWRNPPGVLERGPESRLIDFVRLRLTALRAAFARLRFTHWLSHRFTPRSAPSTHATVSRKYARSCRPPPSAKHAISAASTSANTSSAA